MLFSIIIPVYNAGLFLEVCLHSVLNQNVKDIEVICINDGSTDGSLEILKKFANADSRIRIIDQPNQGVSAARNAGLEIVQGKYVCFVDADDMISADYLAHFIQQGDVDMITSCLDANVILAKIGNQVLSEEDIQKTMFPILLETDVLNSVCVKSFRAEIIKNNNIEFPVGMALGEDAHFVMAFLSKADSCRIIENKGYFYRENVESATRKVIDGRFLDRLFEEFYLDHKGLYQIKVDDKIILDLKSKKLLSSFINTLSLYFRQNDELDFVQRKEIVKNAIEKLHTCIDLYGFDSIYRKKGKFTYFLYKAVLNRSFQKLRWAFAYSHYRNQIK